MSDLKKSQNQIELIQGMIENQSGGYTHSPSQISSIQRNPIIIPGNLNEVLAQLKESISDTQVEFLQSYINAGEWNLALETLCDLLIEEEIPINSRGYELLQEVGNVLNVEGETWEMLKVQVTP
ncbi:MAG: MafI family immunity protein [Oscillatoriaceae cyanobacterium Prado104]|jgi:hypothetical protein|nr:MafI family immunity protein [Oscillatoriaceae cyanobacterium Prado104]